MFSEKCVVFFFRLGEQLTSSVAHKALTKANHDLWPQPYQVWWCGKPLKSVLSQAQTDINEIWRRGKIGNNQAKLFYCHLNHPPPRTIQDFPSNGKVKLQSWWWFWFLDQWFRFFLLLKQFPVQVLWSAMTEMEAEWSVLMQIVSVLHRGYCCFLDHSVSKCQPPPFRALIQWYLNLIFCMLPQ